MVDFGAERELWAIAPMLRLNSAQHETMLRDCRNRYPGEACGLLAGRDGQVLTTLRLTNEAETPQTRYLIAPAEQFKAMREMREQGLEFLGIYHSHSKTAAEPSATDIEMAYYPDVRYVIVSLADFDRPVTRAFIIKDKHVIEDELLVGD